MRTDNENTFSKLLSPIMTSRAQISLHCFLIIIFIFNVHRGHSHFASEESRSLVISSGGIIKLIVGLTMPVDLPVGLIWLQNFQFQYPMIDSANQLTYLNLLRKSTNRAFTRNMVYETLSETWNRFGMNGTACVLRTICDVARYSLSHNGIIGELLHTIFRSNHIERHSVFTETLKNTEEAEENAKLSIHTVAVTS